MKGYQSDISKFEKANSQILAISTDSPSANKAFAAELKLTFPVLSDPTGRVTREYGILNPKFGFANRTTFVINGQGIIRDVETGSAALNPSGACNVSTSMSHGKK